MAYRTNVPIYDTRGPGAVWRTEVVRGSGVHLAQQDTASVKADAATIESTGH